MSFQAYLDTVKIKTGKTPADFKILAQEKGLGTYAEIFAWLKADFGLGHGHANAVAQVMLHADEPKISLDEAIARHFAGKKALWRSAYDDLIKRLQGFGPDVAVSTTSSYINILRKGKKFAIVQVSAGRLDIGIKLKGTPPEGRFTDSGAWNAMVTHRVQISEPKAIDTELISWLRQAYDNV